MRFFSFKKFLSLVLAVIMVLSICACGAETEEKIKKKTKRTETETTDKIHNEYIDYITDTNSDTIDTITHEIEFDESRSESYNVLVMGHDRAAMLTDVMMLVNVDSVADTVTVMHIPRDTYVANHDDVSVPTNKVNALFSTFYFKYYRSGESKDDAYEMALGAVADDLEKALAVDIDFSIVMDLDGFRSIVDTLGGVEIYVSRDMYYNDPESGILIDIPAGYQTLDGEAAEGFVRYRYDYATADFGRQNAQKQFIAALMKKVKTSISVSNFSLMNELAEQIKTYVDTDMSSADILYFGKTILGCELKDLTMLTMPGNLSSGWYVMNRSAAKSVMSEFFYRYEGNIPDSMFDADTMFNDPDNSQIDDAYNKPVYEVFVDSIYDGESVKDIIIH